MSHPPTIDPERVLVLAPTPADAALTPTIITDAGLAQLAGAPRAISVRLAERPLTSPMRHSEGVWTSVSSTCP